MTTKSCPRAGALAAAAERGSLDAEQRAHVRVCDACATELAIVASGALARGLVAAADLPSARQTLLRGRLEARRREAERRLRPLVVWQSIVLVAASVTALWLLPPMIGALVAPPAAAIPASPARLVVVFGFALLLALPFLARGRRRSV